MAKTGFWDWAPIDGRQNVHVMSTSPDLPPQPTTSLVATDSKLRFNKPVEMVHSVSERSLTPVQARISNVLLRHVIQHDPDDAGWYTIGIGELRRLLQFDSRNYAPLLAAANALQKIQYEWDILVNSQNRQALLEGKLGSKNKTLLRASVLFPEIEVSVKTLRYQVSRPVVALLLRPEMYAALDLGIINRLRRTASILLYEQIQRYSKLKSTRRAPWEAYKYMLLGREAAKSPLMDYRRFKARVLTPAIAEIESQHPSIKITLNEFKEGGSRRISEIAFGIQLDPNHEVANTGRHDPNVIRLIEAMIHLGITQATARSIISGERQEDIDLAIQFVAERIQQAASTGIPIRSPAAFLRQCLKGKWWIGTPLEQQATSPQRQAPIAITRSKHPSDANEMDILMEQFKAHQRDNAQRDLLELPASEKQIVIAHYNDQQLLARLKFDGTSSSKMAEAQFLNWYIKAYYPEPTDQDLLKFAAKLVAKAA